MTIRAQDEHPHWKRDGIVQLADQTTHDIMDHGEFRMTTKGIGWHFKLCSLKEHSISYHMPQLGDVIISEGVDYVKASKRTYLSNPSQEPGYAERYHPFVSKLDCVLNRTVNKSTSRRVKRANLKDRKAHSQAKIQAQIKEIIEREGAYHCTPQTTQKELQRRASPGWNNRTRAKS